MKRKVLAVALAVAMLAASLTGCGDSAATSGSKETSGKESVAATKSESGTTENAGVSLESLPESIELGVTVAATPEMYANTDLSKSYTVNMYLIGDTPNDVKCAHSIGSPCLIVLDGSGYKREDFDACKPWKIIDFLPDDPQELERLFDEA